MKETLDRIISKVTSARFIVTLMVVATYCFMVHKTLGMYAAKQVSKDFFFGMFSGFSAIVGSIVTFYFTRPDRKNGDNNAINSRGKTNKR